MSDREHTVFNEDRLHSHNWKRYEWEQSPPIANDDIHTSTTAEVADEPMPAEETRSRSFAWQAMREILETLLLTLLIFWLVRIPTQTFRIEGSSMEPNLHEGQYLIVNKALYWMREPERGEIVVFRFSEDPPKDYIKRVIGLPGETIEIRRGRVYVNGTLLPEPWQPNPGLYSDSPITLEADQYYVLGDNRNNSSDSHTWGPVERNRMIGKAWISYWPPKIPQTFFPPLRAAVERFWSGYRAPKAWGFLPSYADPLTSSARGTPATQPAQASP